MQDDRAGIDSKAFEILVRLHHRRMRAYALSLVEQPAEADDLVQDGFVTAYQNLAKFDPTRDFCAWLRGIIRMKYLERARVRRMTTLDESVLEAIEQHHCEWDFAVEDGRADALVALRDCITRLGAASRRAIELYYNEQQGCQAIAEYLGTNETVVKKRLQRAREDLAQCIRYKLSPGAAEHIRP
ncbi:MAG TPA: sigma-70 family RNA polymerase sigma factor [Planctomycetota bacterium]|nr:sigma-70 family RNA polymerase sigma factor [Planctomycetota bacterium]